MLRQLGLEASIEGDADPSALAWRRAGLCELTGQADGPGLVCPAALACAADGALLALKAIAAHPHRLPQTGALLLGERGRLLGLRRGGATSPNGSCRILEASDGRIALNLARTDDWPLLPILLDRPVARDWAAVAAGVAALPVEELMRRGVELGLALGRDRPPQTPALLMPPVGPAARPEAEQPLVIDFSALWAGPLAGSLLGALGAEVVKVESVGRPDGARFGDKRFYNLMNAGKRSVALDFSAPDQLAALRALVARADIVIEASRPRALRRLGLEREAFAARGGVWVSITAHGGDDREHRVGFGDDAAVEAGLATVMARGWGEAMFAGDAIADPLTGLHAALAAWAAWRSGQGRLIEIALSDVTAHALDAGVADEAGLSAWRVEADADSTTPLYPLRHAVGPAAASGVDTRATFAAWTAGRVRRGARHARGA